MKFLLILFLVFALTTTVQCLSLTDLYHSVMLKEYNFRFHDPALKSENFLKKSEKTPDVKPAAPAPAPVPIVLRKNLYEFAPPQHGFGKLQATRNRYLWTK
uniref:Uncharacterized protein n=2 Tax=Panagrolaimus sp. JU765 TaxID=591449 RepID=A0AC34QKU7_9BILA